MAILFKDLAEEIGTHNASEILSNIENFHSLAELQVAVGDVTDLDTTSKIVVGAINELKALIAADEQDDEDVTGDIEDLNTTAKTNLVAAINEVLSALELAQNNIADTKMGNHTVTAGEASANAVVLATPLGAGVAISSFIVQIYRAGVIVTADAVVTATGTNGVNLTITDGASTYNVTSGDVINYIVHHNSLA